ncbi:ROK family transcriptional regulator [Labrys wisconsinensis]|uniref:NBD/HSP70 family sugar kinase n=1 Tax=Labrys wisconsinensis TaxID=425677 RepID=A0ABU0J7T7_9HYPH|nr:ROK family transcriptional regulator [Labrys wisconsinensis]MDQ0469665.1 putative NBD/HSP70 family sugar kinase [Labrys wisconsinensis]
MTLLTPTSPPPRPIAGTNLEYARSHNRRVVLEAVRRAGTLSRADIARQTALTAQTISNIVDELAQTGFLIAGEPVRGARGQPSIPYSINPEGGWSLGFHIARHDVIAVLADLTGRPVATRDLTESPTTPEEAAPIVVDLIHDLVAESGIALSRVLGVGVALPTRFDLGPISTAGPTGLPGWSDPAAREAFRAAIGLPVLIENDAVAAAIGERLYGVARAIESFVLLFLDDGLGAGLFLDGQPFKGAFSNAGEIGHMIVDPGGRPCPCGNRGCLERYVSLRAAYEGVSADPDRETPDSLLAVERTDAARLDPWLREAGPRLATAVNILETVLDPETVIVSGLASPTLIQRLIDSATPLPVSAGAGARRRTARVIAGTAGRYPTAYGAAALPVFDEMNPRFDVLLKG